MRGRHLPSFRACLNSRRPMPERRYTSRHSSTSSRLARRTGRSSQHSTARPCRWKSPAPIIVCTDSTLLSASTVTCLEVTHAGLLIGKSPQLFASLLEVALTALGPAQHCQGMQMEKSCMQCETSIVKFNSVTIRGGP